MLTGVMLCLATGAVWTLVGILYSRASQRDGGGFVPFMAAYSLVFVGTAWTIGHPMTAPIREVALTAAYALAAAFFGQCGFLALYFAMRRGGHGVAWALMQSALAVPFLCGVLFFGNRPGVWACCGLAMMLVAVALIGAGAADANATKSRIYLLLAFGAMLLTGVSQALTLVPGHLGLSAEALTWRVPFYSLAGLGWWVVLFVRREKYRFSWLGVLYGVVVAAGQFLLYQASDCLERHNAAALAYPIAVGTCILMMRIYSRLVRKECFSRLETVGLALLLAGIALLNI
ncbi:MAG: hypothetical protein J5654_07365 [Victivallales bacterium]|nr:hypothetical protein [Victivallales bacterium]